LILTVLSTLGMFVMFFILPPSGQETIPILYNILIASLVLLSLRHRDLIEKDRQAELAESEARFRAVFMEAPIGVAMIDENLRFVRVNHRLCEMLAYTDEALQQLKFNQIVDPEDENDSFKLVKIEQRYQVERRFIDSKGKVLWVHLTASKIHEKNAPYGLLMIEDITERKEMEQAARKAELLRVQLEKEREVAEFKDRFMSAVSHEFRTPLTTILSSNEMMERYGERMEAESRKEHHTRIQTSVKRLTHMMDDLLNISRSDARRVSFNPRAIDLEAFCQALVNEIKTTNAPENNLIFQSSGHIERFFADVNLMRYILNNLILNAVKYTPDGSDIHFELLTEDNAIILKVADTGIGISEDDQKHLFEPFFRGSNVGTIKGSGLGLKIVKDYVELHGGTISCESQIGEGTTFIVRFPVRAQTESTASPSAAAPSLTS
jgi:PAS domain S-box-containing protein